ncbi:DUF695 domain-containing protein [Streptosporangiaceae bacterium NEAU-GS5]|nr:DUF695 domain-containing protein [Streptosporangiaceae bacterium NEAU-GS5]
MRLFGRKSEPAKPEELIADFWAWWDDTRPQVDALVEAGDAAGLADLVGPAVSALDPSLLWEVEPGRLAQHSLVVSASGNPELRSFAHRWALAAPEGDESWEFHPSRQPLPPGTEISVDVNGHDFGLDGLVFGLRVPPGTPRVDIAAYHPIFQDIDDDTRLETTLLALDWLLGEDEVARWVGDIVAAEFEPIDAVPAIHLPAVVADVADGFQDEQWAFLEGQTAAGKPLTATARYPLRPVDHPLLDQHVAVTLPYGHADADGQPTEASVEALRDFEERLTAHLAKSPTAVLVAQISAEGARVIHVYADPGGETVAELKELAATWQEGKARVDAELDPSWSAVAPFLS